MFRFAKLIQCPKQSTVSAKSVKAAITGTEVEGFNQKRS